MTLARRSVFGMASGAGSVVIKTALNLLVIPVMLAKLGSEAFGLYLLLLAFLEMSQLVGLGLTNALTRLLGGENADRRPYLKAGHVLFMLLGALVLLTGLALWPSFTRLFNVPLTLIAVGNTAFILMMVEAALMAYSCYYQAVLLSHCAHQWTNIGDTVYALTANIGALIMLALGFDLSAILMVRLLGAVIRLGLMMRQSIKFEPAAIRTRTPLSMGALKETGQLSLQGMMINFSVIISHKIDDIVIAHFLNLEAVAIYELVFRLLGITIQVCLKISEVAFPLFSRMAAKAQRDEARQLFLRMSSLLNFTAAMMIMLVLCYYTDLLGLLSSGKVAIAQTYPVLMIAVPVVLSGVLQMPASSWLFAWGEQKFLTVSSIAAALANLALSLLLVKWLGPKGWGLLGVALGTAIPQLIQHQGSLIRKVCQSLNISLRQYLGSVHGAILVPICISYLWVQLWQPLVHACPMLLGAIALCAGSALLLGAVIWFTLSASPLEKDLLSQHFITPLMKLRPGARRSPQTVTGDLNV